jgi:hypothetical protein
MLGNAFSGGKNIGTDSHRYRSRSVRSSRCHGDELWTEAEDDETDNTSISAIGSLFMTGPDAVHLAVYHNRFAAIPLNPALLAAHGVPQFRLSEETPVGRQNG